MNVLGVIAVAVFGLMIGSFLNVVVHRVPRGLSVVRPRSACPDCGTPIGARDNVPVLGWVLLKGRSRCCGSRISARYPLVEAGTAAAFVGVLLWRGWTWTLPAWWWFAAVGIALALIDLDVKKLPDVLTLPSYVVGALTLGGGLALDVVTGVGGTGVGNAGDVAHVMLRAGIACVAVWAWFYATFVIANLVYGQGGFGYGDVKLSGVLGLYLGSLGWPAVVLGVFAGYLVGGVVGVALLLTGAAGRRSRVPFGPFMIVGAWTAAVWGAPVADWYLRLSGL
ncbi:MAG: prepilin peptidase [Kineosporiaceae bacterium]